MFKLRPENKRQLRAYLKAGAWRWVRSTFLTECEAAMSNSIESRGSTDLDRLKAENCTEAMVPPKALEAGLCLTVLNCCGASETK